MDKTFLSLLILVFVVMSFPLASQDSDSLSTRLNVIESLAKSSDRETKELALDGLKELIDKGVTNGSLDRVMGLLTILANEGITNITYEGMNRSILFPGIRERAATLLGETKDPRALNPLINIIFYDDNAQAVMAAVQGASKIQPDRAGKLAVAYGRILKNTRLLYNNEELIRFTIDAVSASGNMDESIYNNQDLLDGLDSVSQSFSGYGRITRNKASDLLKQIDNLKPSSP